MPPLPSLGYVPVFKAVMLDQLPVKFEFLQNNATCVN